MRESTGGTVVKARVATTVASLVIPTTHRATPKRKEHGE